VACAQIVHRVQSVARKGYEIVFGGTHHDLIGAHADDDLPAVGIGDLRVVDGCDEWAHSVLVVYMRALVWRSLD